MAQEQQKLVAPKLQPRFTPSRSRHYKQSPSPSTDLQHLTFLQPIVAHTTTNYFSPRDPETARSTRYNIQAPNDTLLMKKMLMKGAYKDSWLSPSKFSIAPLSLTSQSRPRPPQIQTARLSVDRSKYSSQGTLNSPSVLQPSLSQSKLRREIVNNYDLKLKFVYSPRSFPVTSKNPDIYLGKTLNLDIMKPPNKLATPGKLQNIRIVRPQKVIHQTYQQISSVAKPYLTDTRPQSRSLSRMNSRRGLSRQSSQSKIAKGIQMKSRYMVKK